MVKPNNCLAQTLAHEDAINITKRACARPSIIAMRDNPEIRAPRSQRYANTKVEQDGEVFDSKAEHRRYLFLVSLQLQGKITGLQRQVPYELIPSVNKPRGGRERETIYLADFVYQDASGNTVVEDVKGEATPEYRIKRKLMLWRHGIDIQEIRS